MNVADRNKRGLRGPSSVRSAVDSRIDFELSAREGLEAIGLRFRDHFIPLGDSATRDASGSSHGCPISIEVRKHGRLKHAEQSTAC